MLSLNVIFKCRDDLLDLLNSNSINLCRTDPIFQLPTFQLLDALCCQHGDPSVTLVALFFK